MTGNDLGFLQHAAAVVGRKMVVAGGQTASGPSNDLKVSPFASQEVVLHCDRVGGPPIFSNVFILKPEYMLWICRCCILVE